MSKHTGAELEQSHGIVVVKEMGCNPDTVLAPDLDDRFHRLPGHLLAPAQVVVDPKLQPVDARLDICLGLFARGCRRVVGNHRSRQNDPRKFGISRILGIAKGEGFCRCTAHARNCRNAVTRIEFKPVSNPLGDIRFAGLAPVRGDVSVGIDDPGHEVRAGEVHNLRAGRRSTGTNRYDASIDFEERHAAADG